MTAELGQIALILAICLSLSQAVFGLVGAARGWTNWMAVVRPATFGRSRKSRPRRFASRFPTIAARCPKSHAGCGSAARRSTASSMKPPRAIRIRVHPRRRNDTAADRLQCNFEPLRRGDTPTEKRRNATQYVANGVS